MLNSQNLRRDGLTALILAAVAVAAVPAVLLRVGGAASSGPAAPASLQAGTLYQDATVAKNAFAQATRTEAAKEAASPSKPQQQDKSASEAPDQAKSVPAAAQDQPPVVHVNETEREDVVAKPALPKRPAERPKPNVVEGAPKPVGEMAKDELRDAVDRYRKWCHEGKIQVSLSTEQLPTEALARFVEFFVLQTVHSVIEVWPEGKSQPMSDPTQAAGRLVGDLDRQAWPAVLVAAAERWLGKANRATAFCVLTDQSQLLVYRALASGVGDRKLPSQAEYRLGLGVDPATHQLTVKFLERR